MDKTTLIGIVTFGNLEFTKMAVESIEETVTKPYEFYIIVGQPNDSATREWLKLKGIPYKVHSVNMGFPSSVNDIYDYAWKHNAFDNLVIMGNDVIALPHTVDSLIHVMNTTDNIWASASEVSVKIFCAMHPEAKRHFTGEDFIFTDFTARPWKEFPIEAPSEISINKDLSLKDCHNLTIFKRDIFDLLGYIDANFYPAYFEDNDFVRRAILEGSIQNRSVFLNNATYFHFWSRTIHQETGGTTPLAFNKNQAFYKTKWGGDFGQEAWTIPFNGGTYSLTDGVDLVGSLNIDSREQEIDIINYWRKSN